MAWWHPKAFGMELWDQGYLSHPCPHTFFFSFFFFLDWKCGFLFFSRQLMNASVQECKQTCPLFLEEMLLLSSKSVFCLDIFECPDQGLSGSLWFAEKGGSVSVSHFSSAHTKWCFTYISLVELREWSFQRTMVWTLVSRNLMRDRGNHSQRWQLNAQTWVIHKEPSGKRPRSQSVAV